MVDQTWRTGVDPQRGALAGHKTESDLGMSERKSLHHIGDGGGLDPLRFHEFEPRRRRIKEIAHLDAGAGGERSRLERRFPPCIHFNRESLPAPPARPCLETRPTA